MTIHMLTLRQLDLRAFFILTRSYGTRKILSLVKIWDW